MAKCIVRWNKSAKNHDGFLGNGGQHVIVVTFKTSKRSWATAGQNQNSIVECLDFFPLSNYSNSYSK